jgi:hypothetical protein
LPRQRPPVHDWEEAALIGRLYPALSDLAAYQSQLARITADSNELLFSTVERVADVYQHDTGQLPQPALPRRRCEMTLDVLLEHRNAFMLRHQGLLLRALEAAE